MPSACGGAASASSIWTWLCPPGFQSLKAAVLVSLLVFFIAAISGMDVWTGRSLLVSGFENAFLFGFRLSTFLLMMGEGHIEKALERMFYGDVVVLGGGEWEVVCVVRVIENTPCLSRVVPTCS